MSESELVNHMLNLKIPVMLMPIGGNSNTQSQSLLSDESESYCTTGNYYEVSQRQPTDHERYIIIYKNDVDVDGKTNRLNRMSGFHSKHKINRAFKGCTASLNKGLLSKLLDDPDILYLEKDIIFHNTCYSKEEFVENETTKQIGLWHQNMTNTQPQTTDDYSQTHCYIVDTGIQPTHQEFTSGQVILDYNAINKSKNASDDHGHGTAVASMVGGNTVGVAKKTVLHAIKVLASSGTGYTSDIIAGLNWIIENKKTPCVINMSLGGNFSSSLNSAVQNCILNGISVVCASGNEGIDSNTLSPANTVSAITVSAHDSLKTKPKWSNYGSVVDTFAPGVSVKSAWGDANNSYYLVNGTSFAAPITAGIVCRFIKSNSTATPTEIAAFLSRTNLQNEIVNTGSATTPNLRITWDATKLNPC